ncbi:MAG: tetratricopeptide repeat-containing sulfotransferase family protein [Rhodanobacteraceae bacterium]
MAQDEQAWLDRGRACVLRGDLGGAETVFTSALAEYPRSFDLRRALAGVYQQTTNSARAELLLRELHAERPGDFASALALARLLLAQARGHAAAQVLLECFRKGEHDPELAIKAIEMLDHADRKIEAAAIARIALAVTPDDARLHAYSGMLQIQLGQFEQAREHYLYALEHAPEACEWHVPLGLASAQRYHSATHPDFALFHACAQRVDLGEKARSTLLFALGKAHDDIGDYAQAASNFREANALARALTRWSRKDWRRGVEARLAARPFQASAQPSDDFVPVFIVGMPRSGTTLLAQLLGRFPGVRNRGELPWIARFARLPEFAGEPTHAALERAAAEYRRQATQDDSGDSRWFIDKQPLNFRYVDLMLAMFPNARIIHSRRSARDTALSLWMQSFTEDVQGHAYDFGDIAAVKQDEVRLMERWRELHGHSIHDVRYEELVANPQAAVADVANWIGLEQSAVSPIDGSGPSISTASLWQARQPIYRHSLERWRNYEGYVPELMRFPSS